uniref:Clathrin binding protein n=1 Tax=Rhizophora mucronata TaxID=61149 RepID=A0A2P2L288_RHIMU
MASAASLPSAIIVDLRSANRASASRSLTQFSAVISESRVFDLSFNTSAA